jgi:hypothetical protein
MIDLTDMKQVKAIQNELRTVFDNPSGREVIKFMDQICGWYDFSAVDPNQILIGHGKRQVLATLKTLLELPAEQVLLLTKAG